MSTPAAPPAAPEAARWLAHLVDPANRFWRYPAARALLRTIGGLPITPNQVSLFHGALGLVSAALIAFGSDAALLPAFLLLEVRGVLDCYDGVLARAHKVTSPYGRALDELMDGTSFVAVNLAIAWRVHTWPVLGAAILVFLLTATAAWAYDFFRRKLGGALERGADTIVEDLRARAAAPPAAGLARASAWFDLRQVWMFSRHSAEDTLARAADPGASLRTPDVDRVLASVGTPRFRRTLHALAFMSGDNPVTLIGLGILVGRPAETLWVALAYGVITLFIGCRLGIGLLRKGGA